MQTNISFWIEGKGIGKARPRLSQNGAYTEPRYRRWKDDAILQMRSLNIPFQENPVEVACSFVNFFSSDTDNLIGSVLDAMVQAGIIGGDSSRYVTASSGKFLKTQKLRNKVKPIGIHVEISAREIEVVSEESLPISERRLPL